MIMTETIKMMCIHCVTAFVTSIVSNKMEAQVKPECATFVEVSKLCPNAKQAAAKAAESGYLVERKFINGAMYELLDASHNANCN